MNTMTRVTAVVLALGGISLLAPGPAQAAHAGAPYTNVDHSNDMGNDTGDSQVEKLNAGQLNENYHGPLEARVPAASQPAMAPPSAPPPRGTPH
jgi:hypothetical protein